MTEGKRKGRRRRLAAERRGQFGHAHDHQHGHADCPGQLGVAAGNVSGSDHAKAQGEHRGGIDAQRHGADVLALLAPRQAKGQPGIQQIAQQHARRRARHHAAEDDLRRQVEYADQDSRHPHHQRDVVDGQSEESVDVAAREPVVVERG